MAFSLVLPTTLRRAASPRCRSHQENYSLKPRGFCAGVVRAINVVRISLDLYGGPIYVRKEIVHNRHVIDELAERRVRFSLRN